MAPGLMASMRSITGILVEMLESCKEKGKKKRTLIMLIHLKLSDTS